MLNLSVRSREVVLLEGGMGSGKSTLIKLIAGLIRPKAGSVHLFGEDIAALSQKSLLKLRERLGVVLERDGFIASWSVRENLLLPLRYRQPDEDTAHEAKIRNGLASIGESESVLDQRITQLTGRQRRRLALLRVLLLEPELMLLDELPTYLSVEETETSRILAAMNQANCAIIASAPASWSRHFPGRKVSITSLDDARDGHSEMYRPIETSR